MKKHTVLLSTFLQGKPRVPLDVLSLTEKQASPAIEAGLIALGELNEAEVTKAIAANQRKKKPKAE